MKDALKVGSVGSILCDWQWSWFLLSGLEYSSLRRDTFFYTRYIVRYVVNAVFR